MGSQESLLRLPGRGVARRAGLVDSTRIVYPGSGREDAQNPSPALVDVFHRVLELSN